MNAEIEKQAFSIWKQMADVLDKISGDAFRDLSCADITLRQIKICKTIYELTRDCPEGVTLKRLASELNLSPATASELVDALVKKNGLERTTDPRDRRAVNIRLTQFSLYKIQESIDYRTSRVRGFLEALPESERAHLATLMEQFDHYIKES